MKRTRYVREQVFIIHRRPFCKERHFIFDCLSKDRGLIRALASIPKKRQHAACATLQPFTLLDVQFNPSSSLPRLQQIESNQKPVFLHGNKLYSGLYLNELLIKILDKFEAESALFDDYRQTILALETCSLAELPSILRHFENNLFSTIGYSIPFPKNLDSKQDYCFHAADGIVPCLQDHPSGISGQNLINIRNNTAEDTASIRDRKRLHQAIIAYLTEGKTLTSRTLVQSSKP